MAVIGEIRIRDAGKRGLGQHIGIGLGTQQARRIVGRFAQAIEGAEARDAAHCRDVGCRFGSLVGDETGSFRIAARPKKWQHDKIFRLPTPLVEGLGKVRIGSANLPAARDIKEPTNTRSRVAKEPQRLIARTGPATLQRMIQQAAGISDVARKISHRCTRRRRDQGAIPCRERMQKSVHEPAVEFPHTAVERLDRIRERIRHQLIARHLRVIHRWRGAR